MIQLLTINGRFFKNFNKTITKNSQDACVNDNKSNFRSKKIKPRQPIENQGSANVLLGNRSLCRKNRHQIDATAVAAATFVGPDVGFFQDFLTPKCHSAGDLRVG
jgi:hypothetical protein